MQREPSARSWWRRPGVRLSVRALLIVILIVGVAADAGARLVQMRGLVGELSGYTIDEDGRRWDLHSRPEPLFRYKSTDPDVIDGGLFAMFNSATSDPEALLVIEAPRPASGAAPVWQSGYGRSTYIRIWIMHKGVEVFTVPVVGWVNPGRADSGAADAQHRYRLFSDRVIEADGGEGSSTRPDTPPAEASNAPAKTER